jgi:hypothetical protein
MLHYNQARSPIVESQFPVRRLQLLAMMGRHFRLPILVLLPSIPILPVGQYWQNSPPTLPLASGRPPTPTAMIGD